MGDGGLTAFPSALPPRAFQFVPTFDVADGQKPVTGPAQNGDLSAGYYWSASYDPRVLSSAAHHAAWLAMLGNLMAGGVVEVPYLVGPNAPWPSGQSESLGDSVSIDFALYADAALNAVQIDVTKVAGSAPTPGQLFAMTGDSGFAHLHLVHAVSTLATNRYRLTFTPDLREDYEAGQFVDFERPACSMFMPLAGLQAAFPNLNQRPYKASPSAKFLEHLPEVV